MSRAERLLQDFRACQGPFPYKELLRLLGNLGYSDKTANGGSGRKFVHDKTKHIIRFHEPHPDKEIKLYLVRQIRDTLEEQGLI
ncbi:HicA protein [Agrobacterium albertimagni AOL15]|uniref:HicA protein n=1 Tax=Agrobacterium albertimagni AOL15 TaxID=1156935 RepID=K2Q4B7_9HYPH|nr:HicA protein [Agrobacterium albertimagni AOL15]